MKHKLSWMLTAMVLVSLVVTACGSPSQATTESPTTAAQPTAATQATTAPEATTAAPQPTEAAQPTTAPTQPTTASSAGATKLQLLGWSSSDAENSLLNQIVQQFNQSQTQYTAS